MTRRQRSLLFVLFGVGVACLGCWLLGSILKPLFVALGVAYATHPAVAYLERHRISRVVSVFLILFLFAGLLAIALLYVAPTIVAEAKTFVEAMPGYLARIYAKFGAILTNVGIEVPKDRSELLPILREQLRHVDPGVASPVWDGFRKVVLNSVAALASLLNLVLIPVLYFFFAKDLPRMREALLKLSPQRYQAYTAEQFEALDRILSGFLRGQIVVCFCLALFYSTVLKIGGVPYAVLIGSVTGFLNLVPYLGPLVGLALSILVCLVTEAGIAPILFVAATLAAGNTLENMFLTPRIVGKQVGLSALESLLAVLVGGTLLGLWGMILAIPLAGTIKHFGRQLITFYFGSSFYTGMPRIGS